MRFAPVALALAVFVAPAAAEENERAAAAEFTKLETQLLGASQLGQREQLEKLVAPEFAYRLSLEDRSDYVLNRSEWFRGSEYYDLKSFEVSRLGAHVFGGTAVVSFQLVTSAEMGGRHDMSGAWFVTDVWTGGPGRWQLTRRFVSRPAVSPSGR